MKKTKTKWVVMLVCLLIASTVCMFFADRIQKDNGNITITDGEIRVEDKVITYKLYTPASATEANPAPGVLMLHGYQNDHETCAAYSIELAKRGAVVMAIDEYGHGATTIGLINRGYVNHKCTVNFGNDSVTNETFVEVSNGSAKRYRLMMNFSNLSFFNDYYTKDSEGNEITDSSCGGIAAYAVLASMPNVDETRLGVSGHSMGTWSSWSVAACYSEAEHMGGDKISPKAIVLQCGELFRDSAYDTEKISFNNVLLLQAKYDEFSYFRDYERNVTDDLLKTDLRLEFLDCDANEAAWNTTYGNFEDGTARRIELLQTNHRLTTNHEEGLATALEWFDKALTLDTSVYGYNDINANVKEYLSLVAMLLVLAAMMPLMELLLQTRYFGKVAGPLPSKEGIKKTGAWVRGAVITILIAASTFPFMTQLGHGLLPLPEGVFRMTIGNGFITWYLLLILIMLFTTYISKRGAKKQGKTLTMFDMGLGTAENPRRIAWGTMGRSALLVLCMVGMVYVVNMIYECVFDVALHIIWPFFRVFTLERFGQFCVYILFFAAFYVLNNSKIMAGLRSPATYRPGFKGFMSCWWRNFVVMAGGLIIVTLIEYIPFFSGIGPGADVLFGSTFGGPFMSILILFVPQVFYFSILCTYCYRRTGNTFTGAFTTAAIACWIVTGGSAIL